MNLPNKLTLARAGCVPIFVYLYARGQFSPAFVVFLLASLTDLLDGYIARKQGLITNFGKIMDPLADKVLVYAAFTCMVADGTVATWMFILVLAREFLVAGMRTLAASEGLVIAAGMSGKMKTVLQMVAVLLLLYPGGESLARLGQIVLWASVFMTGVSGFEYVMKNKHVFHS